MPAYNLQFQQSATPYVGGEVKEGLFGVNILFDRDRDAADTTGGTVSANFARAVDELGAGTFRYPGGTISERLFDLEAPFSSNGADSGTLTVAGALDYASEYRLAMTFVMPTYRFLGANVDVTGHRPSAVDADMVHDFVMQLLSEALQRGVTIDAIELGNEWAVDNRAIFGTQMTPVEYGRIASSLATVIQGAITDFVAANRLPSGWAEPDIVVQVGPGGRAERFTLDGQYVPVGYTGATVAATELIFREFNTDAEQSAVDGLVTHRYLTGSSANIDGWAYLPFNTFERLAAADASFGTFDRYVTEWNVAARNDNELGLKQAASLIAMFAEMTAAGVDQANIWAVQQNNSTRLTNNAGFAGEAYAGLSVAGETFRLLQDATLGLTYAPMTISGDATMRAYGFGNAETMVVYLVNTSEASLTLTVDPSQIAVGYHHVWGATLGISGSDFNDPRAIPEIRFSSANMLGTEGGMSIALDAYEVIQLTFTIGDSGVSLQGDALNNQMRGTDFADTLDGGSGSDLIRGGQGNDQLFGGAGDDRIRGGGGADTIQCGGGDDNVHGGNANDWIYGGTGRDRLHGNSGNDRIFGGDQNDALHGGDGDDRLHGEAGNDKLSGDGGADVFVFAMTDGRDIIVDFEDGVDTIQLSGFGLASGADSLNYARQVGLDVEFRFVGGDTLLVQNTTVSMLSGDIII